MAMALRAGLTLRDMEMVQFHPTGLIAGPDTRISGTIIEEGLRGAGGHLMDSRGERFMLRYDQRGERATRDIVSRAMFEQMRKGDAVGPHGGVFLTMRHLDPAMVRKMFKGMVERCRDVGFDLVGGLVEVVPTAHYMMGGVRFTPDCSTELPGLYAAGEDTGGVHGANRLGGNGVANSTVFGGIAGDTMARDIDTGLPWREPDEAAIEAAVAAARAPLRRPASNVEAVREGLHELMWEDAGIIRDAGSLARAETGLNALEAQLERIGVDGSNLAFNLTWHDWLNLKNLILVSRAIVAAAVARVDSRGAHFRSDYPQASDLDTSRFTCVALREGRIDVTTEPVAFTRVRPGESLIRDAAAE